MGKVGARPLAEEIEEIVAKRAAEMGIPKDKATELASNGKMVVPYSVDDMVRVEKDIPGPHHARDTVDPDIWSLETRSARGLKGRRFYDHPDRTSDWVSYDDEKICVYKNP
jgi:hypothetical protein